MGEDRPFQIENVVDGDDQDVEEVAAEQIRHRHVERAHAHRRHRDGDLRRGGRRGNQQGADEGLVPAHGHGDLLADEGQPDAGGDDDGGGQAVADRRLAQADFRVALDHVLDEFGQFLPLVAEHRAHGEEVHDEDEGRGGADVADGERGAPRRQQQRQADDADQHDAEAGGEDVAAAGTGINRLLAVQEIHHHQDAEIEDAAAEDVADGDVGRIGRRDGGKPGGQLRQRGDGGEQDQADPAAAQAGLLGDDVAVARQARAGEAVNFSITVAGSGNLKAVIARLDACGYRQTQFESALWARAFDSFGGKPGYRTDSPLSGGGVSRPAQPGPAGTTGKPPRPTG